MTDEQTTTTEEKGKTPVDQAEQPATTEEKPTTGAVAEEPKAEEAVAEEPVLEETESKKSEAEKEAEALTGIKGRIIKPEEVRPGNTIRVHQKIKEENAKGEEKERIQVFQGMVLGIRGSGIQRSMTVRKISNSVGVEKIFPLHLPSIVAIELIKVAKVRRAKLGFLRDWKKKLREKMITG